MPQILSSIAGNIFGMKVIKNLRLEDVIFPEKLIKSFKGPKFGIQGIRKIFDVWNRPLTATVPKPKVGLSEKEEARIAYEAWVGGIDLEKSDENLASMKFNKFKKRIELLVKMREKAEKETGERKSFLPNITAETREMCKRAKFVKDCGGEYVMVDIITAGWAALQTLREECEDLKLAIHAHRAMHAAMTRKKHGISMNVIAKIARIIGVDQLHTGTANIGKLESGEEETKKINSFLQSKFYNLKTVFPVASGGLHPGLIPPIIKLLGRDIVIQCGGGLWGHPMGGVAGAKAIRQAIESALQEIPLLEYAKTHRELKIAIEKWGYKLE
jgi:ribulose-bisphosphate carboxylase large chain